jgi:UTP--glucose-1-phosphate uridylyltransferase
MGVQEVPHSVVQNYGIVKYKEKGRSKYEIEEEIEKPTPDNAPSNMAVFGRYIFNYEVIKQVEKTSLGIGNELWVTDVLNALAKKGKKIIAQPVNGEWLTTGDPLNYLKATIRHAMRRPELKTGLLEYLKSIENDE